MINLEIEIEVSYALQPDQEMTNEIIRTEVKSTAAKFKKINVLGSNDIPIGILVLISQIEIGWLTWLCKKKKKTEFTNADEMRKTSMIPPQEWKKYQELGKLLIFCINYESW